MLSKVNAGVKGSFTILLIIFVLGFSQHGSGQGTITTNPGDPVNVGYTAGSQSIAVTTSNSSSWTATRLSGASWASPSGSSGNSGDSFTVSFLENTNTGNRSAVYQITATNCDPITVSVIQSREGIPPVINHISSTHANGSYKSGEIIYIDVYYTDANTITLSGSNLSTDFYLNLNNGAKAYYHSDDPYSSGTKKITFKYTVGSSSSEDKDLLDVSSVSISGNVTVKDAAGNNADNTTPSGNNLENNNTLRIDNTPPYNLFDHVGCKRNRNFKNRPDHYLHAQFHGREQGTRRNSLWQL